MKVLSSSTDSSLVCLKSKEVDQVKNLYSVAMEIPMWGIGI